MPEVSSGTVASLSRRAVGPGAGRISLPKPLTSFIGRERELAQAKRLLQGSYLVTLTGPGGSGKTRLCIAVAGAVAGDYPDGVYFVPLAPVRDPGLVPSTIVQSIGLQDARDVPLMEHLISQLRERQLLIVLDNFEHLLAGAPVVTRLLRETTAVRILVSSRSPLHVYGEQECPVPPLAVPGLDAAGQATTLHGVLHAGRHVLVVPATDAGSVLSDPALRVYRGDLEIVTPTPAPREQGTGPIVLIRPDGHVAARGRLGSMDTITGYLRDLFRDVA